MPPLLIRPNSSGLKPAWHGMWITTLWDNRSWRSGLPASRSSPLIKAGNRCLFASLYMFTLHFLLFPIAGTNMEVGAELVAYSRCRGVTGGGSREVLRPAFHNTSHPACCYSHREWACSRAFCPQSVTRQRIQNHYSPAGKNIIERVAGRRMRPLSG